MKRTRFLVPQLASMLLLVGVISTAQAQKPVMMSAEWAEQACAAWNANPILTGELAESGWAKNDKGRGFKVMHVYRDDCADSPRVELRVSLQDGQARCVYGGKVENKELCHVRRYRALAGDGCR